MQKVRKYYISLPCLIDIFQAFPGGSKTNCGGGVKWISIWIWVGQLSQNMTLSKCLEISRVYHGNSQVEGISKGVHYRLPSFPIPSVSMKGRKFVGLATKSKSVHSTRTETAPKWNT